MIDGAHRVRVDRVLEVNVPVDHGMLPGGVAYSRMAKDPQPVHIETTWATDSIT